MKAYRILVCDDRHDAALELAAEMTSDARACEFAAGRFGSSEHVRAVEVWRGAVRICALGAATRAAA